MLMEIEDDMAEASPNPVMSIVIPAYNEEARLGRSLEQVVSFVSNAAITYEVIVVNNASTDSTREIALSFAERYPFLSVIDEGRKGKGAAVRTGMLAATGDYIIFCDADFSMPVEEVIRFLPQNLGEYDIAIGSREVAGSERIGEPEYRHIMGRVYNWIVRLFAVPRIHDTQAGFKSFRRDVARHLFSLQTIDGWGFDVEVLYVARKAGYKLVEVPITWYYMENSRISPLRDSINMFLEIFKVRLNALRGIYRRKGAA